MNQEIFRRLYDSALHQGYSIQDADKNRYIKRLSDEDAKLMAEADAISLVVTRQVRLVKIEWNDKLFFCVFGLEEPDELPAGLDSAELTPALFSIGVLTGNVYPSAIASKIRDAIEGNYIGDDTGYDGHDLNDIVQLFPSILIYQGTSGCYDYHSSEYRVLGALLAKSYRNGPIQLDATTFNALSDLLESGTHYIPYKNIVQGLLAISWENLFLETYRCVEQLYAQPRASKLRLAWKSGLSLRDIAALLEDNLSWRPKEDESLHCLVQTCSKEIISIACIAFGITKEGRPEENITFSIAREIYKLRNQIVHYRPATESVNKTDENWNEIIRLMISIINQLYSDMGSTFFEAVPDNIDSSQCSHT